MRTKIDRASGATITYPNEIAFAFNPLIIRYRNPSMSGTPLPIEIRISVSLDNGDALSIIDKRDAYNREIMMDISSYVQVPPKSINVDYKARTSPSKMMRKVDITVDGFVLDPIYAVWGAMSIGDKFNAGKKIKFFKNYPFSLSMYAPPTNSVHVSADGGPGDMFKWLEGDILNIVPAMAEIFDSDTQHYFPAEYKVYGEAQYLDTVNTGAQFIRFDVDNSTEGVYLRWINRQGGINYWLFSAGDTSIVNKRADGELNKNIEISGIDYNVAVPLGKQTVVTQRLCASLIASEGYGYVSEVSSSPIVEMYHEGSFVPVTVLDQTIVNTNKSLQNIEITISYPHTINQHL